MTYFQSSKEMAIEATLEAKNNLENEIKFISYVNNLDQGLELFDASNEAPEEYFHYMANRAVEYWTPKAEIGAPTESVPF